MDNKLYTLVYEFFKNHEKTMIWFSAPNPLLGGISPNQMIEIGKEDRLSSFVKNVLDENIREENLRKVNDE